MQFAGRRLRHELKYYIHNMTHLELRRRLPLIMGRDPFALEDGNYHIRSLYFDDKHNSALLDKAAGIFRRNKYRIRIYNKMDNLIKLERKGKYGPYIGKESATLTREEYNRIMDQDVSFLFASENKLLRDFYFEYTVNLLRPKVIVDYDREAYAAEEGDVRITFDKLVRAGINTYDIFSPDLITITAIQPPVMIMEVKYNDFLPANIQLLLQNCGSQHAAASKYVMCRAIKNNL